ncbi:hypothetical protein ACBZ92_07025 [Priestia aryabhattai]|uniref:hypothetical protein n=1 Tax=Priestia aryabhattai TaxID=412384 RepID=UPI0024530423|nr:hypothetical protein [Priestia aryabhattai]MDH3125360.1 hypothetical protein [Priestia aryabhattai]
MSSEQKTDKNKALNRKQQYQLFDLSQDEELNSPLLLSKLTGFLCKEKAGN